MGLFSRRNKDATGRNQARNKTSPASAGDKVQRPLSKRKRLAFACVLLILFVGLMELASWVVLRSIERDPSLAELRANQEQLAAAASTDENPAEAIHPYLGWVINPEVQSEVEVAGHKVPVNTLGFVDDGPGLLKKSPDKYIVGIAGGSVAQQLCVLSSETLKQKLAETPALQGKKIELVRIAFSGQKQPQQLIALSYLLALGGEFDVVVNIDGYNEVALPVFENDAVGVFVAYPRAWHTMTKNIVDPREYSSSFRLLQLRAERQAAAAAIVSSPLRFSPTRNLIWRLRDRWLDSERSELEFAHMQHRKKEGRGFVESGPPQLYSNKAGMYEHLADLWRRSSLQMNALCRSAGAHYIHLLQPNQYLPDSKPMGAQERHIAIYEKQGYGNAIREGYPLLIREGERLREAGVDFHDLTQMFASISEPIYADLFCHYNQQGNDLLAERVAKQIGEALNDSKPVDPNRE